MQRTTFIQKHIIRLYCTLQNVKRYRIVALISISGLTILPRLILELLSVYCRPVLSDNIFLSQYYLSNVKNVQKAESITCHYFAN